ncbi:DUF421 domain-containing protein [Roseicyclus sp. F158]|uniref:DUF421 domain-containing protein n=1 Tax=Tropicimonas omnivorans TaxID=3075590 RepID=A0ABU3DDV1_9RHOB|nr:YetF domain-containing protein [Roseicyclus sp. F158]MDT0681895.1 DUF421 domain-containing protein [Roseicyclus sp. F158]
MTYIEPFLRALVAVPVLILIVRMNGLRSFSKMSSFDFALTVATGSLLATTIVDTRSSLVTALIGIASVFFVQRVIATFRRHAPDTQRVFDNSPLLLMENGEIFEANLKAARLTRTDLMAKLREAGIVSLGQVRAVVLETTGDVSVLSGEPGGPGVEEPIMLGVRRGAGRAGA